MVVNDEKYKQLIKNTSILEQVFFERAIVTTKLSKALFEDEKRFNLDGSEGCRKYYYDLKKINGNYIFVVIQKNMKSSFEMEFQQYEKQKFA